MITYILIIIFLFISCISSANIADDKLRDRYEKRNMVFYVIVLSSLAALKYVELGTDMYGYMLEYEKIYNISFSSLLTKYPDNYGYYILSKFFSFSGLSYHYWFAFVEAIYFGSMMMFIYHFSEDRMFSMLMSFTISVFDFSLRGSKQTLAMGFTMLALLALMDKKYARSVILYFVAYTCHPSCLIFLICPFIYGVSAKKSFWPVFIGVSVALLFFNYSLLTGTLNFIGSEHYSDLYSNNRSQYSSTTFIFYATIFIVGAIAGNNYKQHDPLIYSFLMGMSFLCVISQSLSFINKDFFRLAYYFIPFLITFPSNAFTYNIDRKRYKYILGAATIFYCLYILHGGGYQFLWQH